MDNYNPYWSDDTSYTQDQFGNYAQPYYPVYNDAALSLQFNELVDSGHQPLQNAVAENQAMPQVSSQEEPKPAQTHAEASATNNDSAEPASKADKAQRLAQKKARRQASAERVAANNKTKSTQPVTEEDDAQKWAEKNSRRQESARRGAANRQLGRKLRKAEHIKFMHDQLAALRSAATNAMGRPDLMQDLVGLYTHSIDERLRQMEREE